MSTTLTRDLRTGESVVIDGGRVVIVLEEKSGKVARLRFHAEPDVRISQTQGRVKLGIQQAQRGVN